MTVVIVSQLVEMSLCREKAVIKWNHSYSREVYSSTIAMMNA